LHLLLQEHRPTQSFHENRAVLCRGLQSVVTSQVSRYLNWHVRLQEDWQHTWGLIPDLETLLVGLDYLNYGAVRDSAILPKVSDVFVVVRLDVLSGYCLARITLEYAVDVEHRNHV
jgi:hypothetical protein